MDDYGVAAAALAGLRVYSEASRGSGRTTRLIASLKGGETVVGVKLDEARDIEHLARRMGIKVRAESARSLEEAAARYPGPFVFTEQFVEREFQRVVQAKAEQFAQFGLERWRPEFPPDVVPHVAREFRERL